MGLFFLYQLIIIIIIFYIKKTEINWVNVLGLSFCCQRGLMFWQEKSWSWCMVLRCIYLSLLEHNIILLKYFFHIHKQTKQTIRFRSTKQERHRFRSSIDVEFSCQTGRLNVTQQFIYLYQIIRWKCGYDVHKCVLFCNVHQLLMFNQCSHFQLTYVGGGK